MVDRLQVDHLAKVVNIGAQEVVAMRGGGGERLRQGNPLHRRERGSQQFIGPILDPCRGSGICRTPVGGIVFEAAIMRRIVRRGDDDAVTKSARPAPIVGEDGMGDHRCGRVFVLDRHHGGDAMGSENLQRAGQGRFRQGMRVHAQEERTIGALTRAELADRLSDGEDVSLIE